MRALVFGSLNIDYVYDVPHFVEEGETLSSTAMERFPGGKGLNQAIALAKSGADSYMAGAVSAADAAYLLGVLQESGVNSSYVEQIAQPNGHAIIQRDPRGRNCIMLYGGTNQMIVSENISACLENFGPDDILVLQNEINANAEIMRRAKARGLKIVLNPSPLNEKIFALPLDDVDVFILNETEAAGLLGREELGQPQTAVDELLLKYPEASILVTLGKDGCVYGDKTQYLSQETFDIEVVDTTAAGDTFTGYFLSAWGAGLSIREALINASAASTLAVSRAGAAPSIPYSQEVREFRQERGL